MFSRSSRKLWVGLVVVQILAYLSLTLLSSQFIYGQGHTERPILLFIVVYLIAWVAFLAASLSVLRGHEILSLRSILLLAVFLRLLLLPSNLIQENDVYRYILDGQAILHGQNPYLYSPLTVEHLAEAEFRRNLSSPEAQNVLEKISYPDLRTVYPPVTELVFASGAWIGGWNWMGQRLIFFLVDLLTLLVLTRLLTTMNKPPALILLYAWNPLVLKEVVNSVHHDILVLTFLALMSICFLEHEQRRQNWWIAAAAFSLAAAVLSKLYPLVLLPACFFYLYRREGWKHAVYFSLFALLIICAGFFPFYSADWAELTEGLRVFSVSWFRNAGFFSLMELITPYPRLAVGVILFILGLGIPVAGRSASFEQLSKDLQWILLFWFLMIPVVYPWYAVPLCGLSILGTSRTVLVSTLTLSGSFVLYYAGFMIEYHNLAPIWDSVVRIVEHGVVWTAIALMGWINIFRPSVRQNVGITTVAS